MHVLSATPGLGDSADEAIDLGQTPGDLVFLSTADSELNLINRAYHNLYENDTSRLSLRLANLLHLRNNYSVDLYVEKTLSASRLVIVRLLGGVSYWRYGVEEIAQLFTKHSVACAFLSGDETFDETLHSFCRGVDKQHAWQLWQYLVHGGAENAASFLKMGGALIREEETRLVPPPIALAKAGLYKTQTQNADFLKGKNKKQKRVAILFYRAYLQAADLEPIDALIDALEKRDLQVLPIYCAGMKDTDSAQFVSETFAALPPDIIINSLGFHLANIARPPHETETPQNTPRHNTLLEDISPYWQNNNLHAPVLQIILSSQSEALWLSHNNSLNIRDIAMYVALTEPDGNIFTRAVSFKHALPASEETQIATAIHKSQASRIEFTADLTKAYCALQQCENAEKRIALILANYPGKDGRIANGVGLDTPQSTIEILTALAESGYNVEGLQDISDSQTLMERLQNLPTNAIAAANNDAKLSDRTIEQSLSLSQYRQFFSALPDTLQRQISEQWGSPEADPYFMETSESFALPLFLCGHIAIAIQPARGYHIDPTTTYHDPKLVPPHNYCATYFWLRHEFGVHAVVHLGKHGNLEWLPGKALALSQECYPEALLGALPHIYPFIVNDPGEGSQAKRRTAATIIDHLTPPMVRAENYGVLTELENLCDEYYESLLMDPKRARILRQEIINCAADNRIDKDCGMDLTDKEAAIVALDGFLCELKESRIRGGLHIFSRLPAADKMTELAVALLRLPRFDGVGANRSILTALASDLKLAADFDPLDCDFSAIYEGLKPEILQTIVASPWRHCGDTVERLTLLAQKLIGGEETPCGEASAQVLGYWHEQLSHALNLCAVREKHAILRALDGHFIAAGSSGAPTRGRADVLPTGRNFYSVDMRAVPTATAWRLGEVSARLTAERYMQEHGDYPRQIAVNVWGTSNMRTGGDDIAQAMAFLGVKPTWDSVTRRVTGFEIIPLSALGRSRIDVTLRISGFFRDAFPSLIELFDRASRAVQGLQEPHEDNPAAQHYAEAIQKLKSEGYEDKLADICAGRRIFGAPSGGYGAGLQALIDEGVWRTRADIAETYLQWGGYAYGASEHGVSDEPGFRAILARTQAVVHNQDNREHDVLDSDDYYQFEGGAGAAIEMLSGRVPAMYHNDHSDPGVPRVRSLAEEIARCVRSRAANPKWIEAMCEHGYKGAFEIAATVDYLFAFAATTDSVSGHHFDLLFEAYVADEKVSDFMYKANPSAWREIRERFAEAVTRGLWKPSRNDWAKMVL